MVRSFLDNLFYDLIIFDQEVFLHFRHDLNTHINEFLNEYKQTTLVKVSYAPEPTPEPTLQTHTTQPTQTVAPNEVLL